jgi:Bacterial extracellular solute-binding proteins, family 3
MSLPHPPRCRRALLTLLSGLWGLTSYCACAEEPLTLAVTEFKPWFYIEKHQKKGIVFDVITSASKSMEIEIETRVTPFLRTYAEVASGRADLKLITYINHQELNEYSQSMQVNPESLFELVNVGMSLKSKNIQIISSEILNNYRLGGMLMMKSIYSGLAPLQTKMLTVSDNTALTKALLSDRIDIAISAHATLASAIKDLEVGNRVEVAYTFPAQAKISVGWSRASLGNRANLLSAQFDATLKEMKARGEIAEIISRYSDITHFRNYGATP